MKFRAIIMCAVIGILCCILGNCDGDLQTLRDCERHFSGVGSDITCKVWKE